jgi:transcriptional repressor NrdR
MICPFCAHLENRVVDSREIREGAEIRRRRECSSCGRRFTTYERVDELPATVVKRDGRRESFDREKLLTGLLKACEKRPVPRRELVAVVDAVESSMAAREVREMTSEEIGNAVIDELRALDQVAYVRFASVYRRFEDIHQFMEELRELIRPSRERGDGQEEGIAQAAAQDHDAMRAADTKKQKAKRKKPKPADIEKDDDQPRLFDEDDEDPPDHPPRDQ